MAKEEMLEFDGVVTEVLPDGNFRVKLDNDHVLLAYMSGKMRKFRIRTGVGDRVMSGQCIGEIPEGKLGARVHASIDGVITSIHDTIVIERE